VSKMGELYKQLEEQFVKWAENRTDIKAAIVVGSRARTDHSADEWADLDIIMVTAEPELYSSTYDWIKNVGDPLLTFIEETPGGFLERRVLFEGMLDVDFAILPEEEFRTKVLQFQQGKIPPQLAAQILDLFGRGIRVLLDKDRMIARLQTLLIKIEPSSLPPPTQHDFLEVVNDFLYHAVFTAKHLQRGELWWTVTCLNCHMQSLLRQMIEWHAKVHYGWSHETWFRGRFLEEWAHPAVIEKLQRSIAHYDVEDIKQVLLSAVDMFQWMAKEVAEKLNYSYPTDVNEYVIEWIRNTLQQ